jgi:glycosyltransferase involved in cell wall biosynthesis
MVEELVSVIMPAYNYGDYVEQAVRSVFSQTYRPLELIAVDDGSSDDTLDVLEAIRHSAPVPMAVLEGGHGGVCAALNLGLRMARGKYVAILHADDAFLSTKVEAQIQEFTRNPKAVLCHTEYQVMDEDGRVVEGLDSRLDQVPAKGEVLRDILGGRCDVRSMTMMYRREVMQALGGYDESLPSEDWQSILRLAAAGPVAHVDDRLVLRRVHRHNYSKRIYRGRGSIMGEIAFPVLQDVVPPDMDLDVVASRSVGTVVANSIAEANLGKALGNIREGWFAFPGGRRVLVKQSLRGFKSLVWMRLVSRLLPERAIGWIRSKKRSVVS